MTAKRVREFEKMLRADGLTFTKPKAEGLRIRTTITAENGAKKEFGIATDSGDIRSELNERGRWRRWVRANTMTLELDLRPRPEPMDVALAARAVASEASPAFKADLHERYEHSGAPVNLKNGNLLANAVAMLPPHDVPHDPPMVDTSNDEIDDALADADAALEQAEPNFPFNQPKETDMPRATLALAKIEPPKTARKNRTLSQVEFFKLCSTLAALDMSGITSIPKLTERLAEQTGMDLSESTVTGALEATGKSLDRPVRIGKTTATEKLLASELVRLIKQLGNEPSPEVLAIAGAEA